MIFFPIMKIHSGMKGLKVNQLKQYFGQSLRKKLRYLFYPNFENLQKLKQANKKFELNRKMEKKSIQNMI